MRSEKLLARRVTHLPEKRPLRILIFLARDLATFLGAQSQSSQPLSVFTRASNLDARKEIHSGRLDRRARSISRIRSACIEVQRSSCVIMITTAQGTFGVLLVPKKCPALVNIKTVVSVRQVASGGGATDVGSPNISGQSVINYNYGDNLQASGFSYAARNTSGLKGGTFNGTNSSTSRGSNFYDASRQTAIYGKSSTLQPSSTRFIPCIKF